MMVNLRTMRAFPPLHLLTPFPTLVPESFNDR
ncbi:hypothetical protein EV696_11018 [Permianibacter aggregans]|uniref:Uncharacterized protein n=1 Tax=Permianibacter aggregans TaxID=1510150 RepID=A0A4R6UMK7_9GAMM|nr:hypothetical protein EV696_11018 [Permianibacter aggregans]